MRKDEIGPDEILILAFKQSISRIALWTRVNVWFVLLSLLLVTIPPAMAGLHYAVRAGLRDPFDLSTQPRQEFRIGVGRYFKRSYALTIINLALLGIISGAILFWFTRQAQTLRMVTAIAISFLLFWWLCQPFLFAQLVEQPHASAWQVYRLVMRLVLAAPLYALVITLTNTLITAFGLLLLGPSLLYGPTLVALISIQAMWGMTQER